LHAGKANGEMPLTGAGSCGHMPLAGAAGGFILPAPERAAADWLEMNSALASKPCLCDIRRRPEIQEPVGQKLR
jgi:hypothetical protein